MTIDQHIEELRAELSNCNDAVELIQIEAELRAAQAQRAVLEEVIAAWLESPD